METRAVLFEGRRLEYVLERKNVKNINLRVRAGGIYASASRRVPAAAVDRFVLSRAAYILAAKDRLEAVQRAAPPPHAYEPGEVFTVQGRDYALAVVPGTRDSAYIAGGLLVLRMRDPADRARRERLALGFMEKQCQAVFGAMLDRLYPALEAMGAPRPTLRFRNMRSRWGVCHVKSAVITLNKRLLPMDPALGEYVVTHELCHLIVPDHSPRFYALLEGLLPDWKARRAALSAAPSHWP